MQTGRVLAAYLAAALAGCSKPTPPAPEMPVMVAEAMALADRPHDCDQCIEDLRHSNMLVRARAAMRLRQYAPHDTRAVEPLTQALKDEEMFVRTSALGSLISFGPAAREALPTVLQLFQDSSNPEQIRTNAAVLLGRIGPDARKTVPTLIAYLEKERSSVVAYRTVGKVSEALGHLGPEARVAIPLLLEVVRQPVSGKSNWDDVGRQRNAAAGMALWRLDRRAQEAVPALVDAIENSAPAEAMAFIHDLAEIGPDAKAAVPYLVTKLNQRWGIGEAVAEALLKIDPGAAREALAAAKGEQEEK